MRHPPLLLVLASIVFQPSIAFSQTPDLAGYGKTKWNMTSAEVLAAEAPRAIQIPPPVAPRGAIAKVAINGIDIAGSQFNVRFRFTATDQLSEVNLAPSDPKSSGSFLFSSLQKILNEKYGPPTYTSPDKMQRINSWKFPTTTITMTLWNIPPGVIDQVNVMYTPTLTGTNAGKDL